MDKFTSCKACPGGNKTIKRGVFCTKQLSSDLHSWAESFWFDK